ncbi:MAG: hypothetical protein RL134_646 [Actinomycetota bacterium]|jgi:hypothetical protein
MEAARALCEGGVTHEPECENNTATFECICIEVLAAYRRGFNDHAAAQQHWQDTHGAYRQHGAGENP